MKKIIFAVFTVCLIAAFSLNAYAEPKLYFKNCNKEMKIALTFDDGPHPKNTPLILDILASYGIHATFFEIGQNTEYYPEVSKRVLEEGHEIGNHTFSHPRINKTEKSALSREMTNCEQTFNRILNYRTNLFRPPEGVVDSDVKALAESMGYKLVLWSVDTRDWAGTSAESIVSGVLQSVSSGDIILMHDYTSKNCHTVEALKVLIPRLLEMGYTFVTVSELIS